MNIAASLLESMRRLREEGLSLRAIARELRLGRRTVRKYLKPSAEVGKEAVPVSRQAGKLDSHRGWLLARLEQHPGISAHALFVQLHERGFAGSYSLVRRSVAQLRPQEKPAYRTLSFEPGEAAQVDWGEWGAADVPGGRRRVSFFVMVLCHSRAMYAEFVFGESMEFWLQCHRNAFRFFGGVPSRVIVDNCRTAVLHPAMRGAPAEINPVYREFADRCGFSVTACAPRHPQSKGMVENAVGYVKSAFLAGRSSVSPPEVINPLLLEWLANTANRRTHGTTGQIPQEVFERTERAALRPPPVAFPQCVLAREAVADSRFRVCVGTNRYSVKCEAASRRVRLELFPERVVVRNAEGALLADHPRCFGFHQEIVDPDHGRPLEAVAGGAAERALVARFLGLGSAAGRYLEGLREKVPTWRNHLRQILAMADIHGRDAVARQMDDCLAHGAFSASYIHNLLDLRARAEAASAPLHVTRNADLMDITLAAPDMEVYAGAEKTEAWK